MAELNEGIAQITPGSTLEALYTKLANGFILAQSQDTEDYTGSEYVTKSVDPETGETVYIANEEKINAKVNEDREILIKNSAYLLASSIIQSVSDQIKDEGISEDFGEGIFLKIAGGSMTGHLTSAYGFEAGDNGFSFFKVFQEIGDTGGKNVVNVDGELRLPSDGLVIGGKNVFRYKNGLTTIDSDNITLGGNVSVNGSVTIGDLVLSDSGIRFGDYVYYHSGNSNKSDVDWTMRNGKIYGSLSVGGSASVSGKLTATNGVDFGVGSSVVFTILSDKTTQLSNDLNILNGGLKLNGVYALYNKNENVLSLSAPGKTLNIGDDGTGKIDLQAGIYDDGGEYELISKYGSAYFPESFKAGYGLGNVLVETYKTSDNDAGIIVHDYVRFGKNNGIGLRKEGNDLLIDGLFAYKNSTGGDVVERKETIFGYIQSTSLYAPLDKVSSSFSFETEADFYVFDKPIESSVSLGIAGSKMRLIDGQLFFNDGLYWQAIEDGIKHYGNIYVVDNIGSPSFSSGFAGSGWKILHDQLTGNYSATFDELTVRKRMHVYELEVQKISATNGAWWISDSCSGDLVEEIL